VQITREPSHIVILEVPGPSLNNSNSKRFKDEMAPVIQMNQNLIFDMRGVQLVDSAGLGAILSCLRRLNANALI
jgi:anti-sigma B factor antagonist